MANNSEGTNTSKPRWSKVRTGCIVCRIRKVKCDELRPHCVRCTSTGRKCEGYIDPPPVQKRTSSSKYGHVPKALSLYSPSVRVSEDISESRSIQYFQSRTVQAISSYFETGFWNHLVLQVSRVEPSVHHALVALSSLHEAYEFNKTYPKNIKTNEAEPYARFALQQYTKAVGLLATNISTDQPSLQGILISCILFVWIEFLRGSLDTALHHLRGGLHILRDVPQRSSISNIDPSLPRLFRRLHTQARLHGSPTSDFNSNVLEKHIHLEHDVPQTFANISEARDSLDTLLDLVYSFMRCMYSFEFVASTKKRHPFPDPDSLESTVQHHLSNLQKWQTSFLSIADSPNRNLSVAITQLELQYVSITIMLKTLLETSEMVFDQYKPDFERILSLAECLIQNTQHGTLLVLSFDIGVMAPLSLVVLKCRYLGVRKQAISLMKQAPDREGIWHRDSCVEVAGWKVQMEERRRGDLPETEPLPEMARIHSERSREVVVEGKLVTIVRFKRGPMDRVGENKFEEEITGLSGNLGEVL